MDLSARELIRRTRNGGRKHDGFAILIDVKLLVLRSETPSPNFALNYIIIFQQFDKTRKPVADKIDLLPPKCFGSFCTRAYSPNREWKKLDTHWRETINIPEGIDDSLLQRLDVLHFGLPLASEEPITKRYTNAYDTMV